MNIDICKVAPIVLFVYNRPYHTRRTLEALEKNSLSAQSNLYIFSDGPKANDVDMQRVNEVREIIRSPVNFANVYIDERERNFGLAGNVINGVTEVVKRYGKIIVLEDDVLLAPYALEYFNDALDKYEKVDKVMHIGSYMYNINRNNLDETFFTRLSMSQAWATWSSAWNHFEEDINVLLSKFDKKKIKAFTFDHTMNFWKQINEQKDGKVDSWAIRWYASIFLNDGLALQTKYSLLENIGHDGSGVHSSISSMFDSEIQRSKISFFPEIIQENLKAYEILKYYFKHRKGSLLKRGFRFLRNKYYLWNNKK
ncbi:sugar transferase [Sphingobacterium spiritivorum]|uniref:sugar transferase n=1 Tax=Sphingobacterium spiritivorum TaxID=258 RepID=UPI003DA63DE8